MEIGEKIRLYLVKNKISQSWLSEEAKIALPKLNMSLNGKRKLTADEFMKICKVLKEEPNRLAYSEY